MQFQVSTHSIRSTLHCTTRYQNIYTVYIYIRYTWKPIKLITEPNGFFLEHLLNHTKVHCTSLYYVRLASGWIHQLPSKDHVDSLHVAHPAREPWRSLQGYQLDLADECSVLCHRVGLPLHSPTHNLCNTRKNWKMEADIVTNRQIGVHAGYPFEIPYKNMA